MLKLDGADRARCGGSPLAACGVAVERVFALGDAAQALAHSRAGHVRGKLVVSID